MEKYLVMSYYDGCIEVDAIKDTYEEAREFMEADVREFVSPQRVEDLEEDECSIDKYSAFVNISNMAMDTMCTWEIKKIVL